MTKKKKAKAKPRKKVTAKATLSCQVEYDPEVTTADSIASVIDLLLYNARSRDDALDELGDLEIGSLYVSSDD